MTVLAAIAEFVAKGIGIIIIATIYIVGLAVCASVIVHPFL